MIYLSNAFSLSMLDSVYHSVSVTRHPKSIPETAISIVGHQSTADLFSALLNRKVEVNRVSIKLKESDILYVGQYVGPRLEEGVTELPEGATVEWFRVGIEWSYNGDN
jgi:hypothetical protein